MKIAFLTLGCKVNFYETEKMKSQCEAAGYQIVSFSEQADVYVVNTCTVTNIADRKSRKMLHRARRLNPAAIVVAVGCYVDSSRQKGNREDGVDYFLSNREKEHMAEFMKEIVNHLPEHGNRIASMSPIAVNEKRTRRYIKVQSGCNQYCSYCIIPYVRGELHSRKDEEIIQEVRQLTAEGCRELVVTGIHLSSFGVDRTEGKIDADSFLKLGGKPLITLLHAISGVEGIDRIRLGSLEPRIITEEFVRELSKISGICPHFHLSLQSGCDATLRRMNRHYTTQEYLKKLEILRRHFDHPAITTDIIVGFPQERQEEFETTCSFVREAAFAQIHVFKYSRRQGTTADSMEGQIQEQIKTKRSDILLKIEAELEHEYQKNFLGVEEWILLEEISEIEGEKYLVGHNERYIKVAVLVENEEEAVKKCNTIMPVQISGYLTQEIMQGVMIQ